MRITHQMLSRNYLQRMNTNLKNLTGSNEKMSSGRAYNKSWENVPDAGKALRTRKLIADNERHLNTIRDAKGRATSAEEGIRTVVQLMTVANDRVVQGLNGTMNDADREKIAIELERAQEEVFQIMNNQFSNAYLYGSSGNADGSAPFSIQDGKLAYNGSKVDNLVQDPVTGKPSTYKDGVYTPVAWNEDNYINIGYGYQLQSDGRVNPNTAFKDTFSGLDSFGYGHNAEGVPLNAYDLLGSMATHLRAGNTEMLGKDLDAVQESMSFMLKTATEIGARGVTLENTEARLEAEYITLTDTQNKLEGIDLSREAINNKEFEMSWMVTLQLGSKILPQTIFDFIR